jgi:hypothetical protein
MRTLRSPLLVWACLLVVAYAAYGLSQPHRDKKFIPAEIQLNGVVGVVNDVGCRAVVYSIARDSLNGIRRDWKGFFSTARRGRESSENQDVYSEWRETPYRETGDGLNHLDRWLTAMCPLSADLRANVFKAIRAPGSYWATSRDSGLLVIPSQGILVYSHVHF